jgi:hypothetical protein
MRLRARSINRQILVFQGGEAMEVLQTAAPEQSQPKLFLSDPSISIIGRKRDPQTLPP